MLRIYLNDLLRTSFCLHDHKITTVKGLNLHYEISTNKKTWGILKQIIQTESNLSPFNRFYSWIINVDGSSARST